MVEAAPTRFKRRLVGQPLLYAISIFASLGVFLVSEYLRIIALLDQRYFESLVMIKGALSYRLDLAVSDLLSGSCPVSSPTPIFASTSRHLVQSQLALWLPC